MCHYQAISYRPQSRACQPRTDLGLVRVCGQKDRDELLVERPPFLWQFPGEVLVDAEVCADEVAGETLLGVDTLRAQHDAVVVPHKITALR